MNWCKKCGTTGSTGDSRTNKMLVWLAWMLATCGFAILLAGVTSMQGACDGSVLNELTQGGGGTVGYLAPVSCAHFFQYTWWITYLHWFVWGMVLTYLTSRALLKARIALVGLCAVAAVLLMDTANTYLYFSYVPDLSGTMASRTKTTVAGAIVSAVADLLLLLLLGWDAGSTATTTTTTTTMPAATAV